MKMYQYSAFDDGTKVEGKIAYFHQDRAGVTSNGVSGSASILLPSGLNFTLAAGDKQNAGSFYYGKVGYKLKFWDIGTTSIGIDYFKGSDQGLTGPATSSSAKTWCIGVVQNIDRLNAGAVLANRNYSFDDDVRAYEDISSIVLGARWSF